MIKGKYKRAVSGLLPSGNYAVGVQRYMLHSLFPRDFEYYLIALELVNSDGDTLDYLTFPILPSDISEDVAFPVTVEKTLSGVSVVANDTFSPVDISLSGNFGVGLKVLVGRKVGYNPNNSVSFTSGGGVFDKIKRTYKELNNEFNLSLKTGWGALMSLESIMKRDGELGLDGKPSTLLMYNSATGNNYVVKSMGITKKANSQRYSIWDYNVRFKGVAPLEWYLQSRASARKGNDGMTIGFIQNSINVVAGVVRGQVSGVTAKAISKLNSLITK